MNTKSSRAEAKDRTGGGLPGWKQWSKPPLKASISVHIFRADENDFRQVVHNLSHHLPSVLFLHLSASCPTVINSPNWKRPYQTFRSNSLQSRNPWTANEFTCNFCLDTPMAGSSLPCGLARSMVGQFCWVSSSLSVILQLCIGFPLPNSHSVEF